MSRLLSMISAILVVSDSGIRASGSWQARCGRRSGGSGLPTALGSLRDHRISSRPRYRNPRAARAAAAAARGLLRCSPASIGRSARGCCSGPARGRSCWLAARAGRRAGCSSLFAIGAVAMRGAGCVYNDIVDRDLDARVARTRARPLPSGQVTPKRAWAFLIALCLVGLARAGGARLAGALDLRSRASRRSPAIRS